MFDLVQEQIPRPYRRSAGGAIVLAACGHAVFVTTVTVLTLWLGSTHLPDLPILTPAMRAFVASAPPPPPPPPPPPGAGRRAATPPAVAAASSNPDAAPIYAPTSIEPEPATQATGYEGGVEGGIEGGVAGGIVGGLLATEALPPPPPPPAPAPPPQPVRVGGAVVAPALLHRVEPVYPRAAVAARVEGVVVLEAIVDVEGRVQEVKVLRPVSLLNEAAVEALKQWRYAPLTIKGVASPWVLVVTLTFKLQARP